LNIQAFVEAQRHRGNQRSWFLLPPWMIREVGVPALGRAEDRFPSVDKVGGKAVFNVGGKQIPDRAGHFVFRPDHLDKSRDDARRVRQRRLKN
jgi:hypothetical protein